MDARVMIMAGGTGGHVFPALAVAAELKQRGADIFWLGAPESFESRTVPEHGYSLELITIQGLRGKGLLRWFGAPFNLLRAMLQAASVIRRQRPGLVIGMGGFVSGPGGLVARLFGIPLVIHEQNAIPGMTNRWLSRIASRVLQAFPDSFSTTINATTTGNPVRKEILALSAIRKPEAVDKTNVNLLIVGGSLGAQALNETVPKAIEQMSPNARPVIRHQAGRGKSEETERLYQSLDVKAEVVPFIADMAEAYGWADLVICRSGALTVAELAAAGVPAILVPFPYAVDDHQTENAKYLSNGGAGALLSQSELTPERLAKMLSEMVGQEGVLKEMALKARQLALPNATAMVADACEEVIAG